MTALARRSITLALGAGLLVAAAVPGVRAATWPEHDAYAVTEDRTLVVEAPGLLMNDTPDGGAPCVVGIDAGGLMGWIGEHGDNGHTGWKTDGSFTFTPYDEWNGTTTFVYGMRTLVDGQCIGAAEGQATVTITVQPVNDPPTAVAGSCDGGITVDQDSGPYDDPSHCVENHAWGPIDENTQLVDEWVVTNDKPELFVDQPAIDVTQTTFGGAAFRARAWGARHRDRHRPLPRHRRHGERRQGSQRADHVQDRGPGAGDAHAAAGRTHDVPRTDRESRRFRSPSH